MFRIEKKSPFKMGWLLVMFDLPVLTKEQRKAASDFRNDLLDDGYFMVQFSVYARACPDPDRMDKHRERLKKLIPPAGNVRGDYGAVIDARRVNRLDCQAILAGALRVPAATC